MEIVELFREVAESFDWIFDYGRKDFHNLIDDGTNGKWHFFLDPVVDDTNSQFAIYEGYFMVLSIADLDQNYDNQKGTSPEDGKWLQNIKPKKDFLKTKFRDKLECADLEILRYRMTEVINFFDDNMDGVLVNFQIKQFL